MSIINFFKRNTGPELQTLDQFSDLASNKGNVEVDIPERIFIEDKRGENSERLNNLPTEKIENNIELLFSFLDINHETRGYDDALINPDITHLDQNLLALKNQLERIIRKVKTFYEDFIREIDFHIESRSRSGMVDMVDELKMKRSIAESHISKVIEIENDTKINEGNGQGMMISYTRGFKNGLAAISHHIILKRF